MNGFQTFSVHVSVNLRRHNVRVPQHFLHLTQIDAVHKQMRRETVTQCVGTDICTYSTSCCVEFDEFPNSMSVEDVTVVRKEEPDGIVAVRARTLFECRTLLLEVSFDGIHRLLADRNDALLASFSGAFAEMFVEMNVTKPHGGKFGNTTAGRVKHFENRTVAQPVTVGVARGGKQLIDLGRREEFRDSLPQFLTSEERHLTLMHDPFQLQILVKDFQRDDVPRHRGGRKILFVEPADVGGKVGDSKRQKVAIVEPDVKTFEVAAVRLNGVGREMALAVTVRNEIFEPQTAVRHHVKHTSAWFAFGFGFIHIFASFSLTKRKGTEMEIPSALLYFTLFSYFMQLLSKKKVEIFKGEPLNSLYLSHLELREEEK